MFKHFLFLTVISVILVIFKRQANFILALIKTLHHFILSKLALIFNPTFIGTLTQQVLALLLICTLVALILTLGYWLVQRSMMPNFFLILWFIWIILLISLTLTH